MGCPLCQRKIKTKFYYEDSMFWIVDCDTCHIPLIVLKHHRPRAKKLEEIKMEEIINKIFDMTKYKIDDRMRKIPQHKHWHLRRR